MMILQPALRRPTYNKSTAQNEQQRKRDHWRMDDREQLRETRCWMGEGREWYRDMRGMGWRGGVQGRQDKLKSAGLDNRLDEQAFEPTVLGDKRGIRHVRVNVRLRDLCKAQLQLRI